MNCNTRLSIIALSQNIQLSSERFSPEGFACVFLKWPMCPGFDDMREPFFVFSYFTRNFWSFHYFVWVLPLKCPTGPNRYPSSQSKMILGNPRRVLRYRRLKIVYAVAIQGISWLFDTSCLGNISSAWRKTRFCFPQKTKIVSTFIIKSHLVTWFDRIFWMY